MATVEVFLCGDNHQQEEISHPETQGHIRLLHSCFSAVSFQVVAEIEHTILTCICLSKSICPLNMASSGVKDNYS